MSSTSENEETSKGSSKEFRGLRNTRVDAFESEALSPQAADVFGDEAGHDIQYKTLSWQFVSLLMIAEIVSNGMLSLPNAMAVVGIVPALILTVFLGIFALYTAKLLIDFKLNHPDVHNMGDAGYILFGPVGREILSLGTIIFAIFAAGSELLSGQQALSTLSDNGLCAVDLLLIFSGATFIVSLPRTLGRLSWLGFFSVALIALSGLLAMIGAGRNPVLGRVVKATVQTNFSQAFLAITGPVFAYAGHFMFFILISEMREPQDAMKAAWCLQGFATTFYAVFSVVVYVYLGSTVASPALLSLPPVWAKLTFGIGLGNFLVAGALYAHTASKLVFIRLFRHTRHVYSHTVLGWMTWTVLCFASVAVAFILATAVPIFSDLIGITASVFASWYTYGLAGFFWLYDNYYLHGGAATLKRRWKGATLSLLTIAAGSFICVAGTYVSVKLIVDAYRDHLYDYSGHSLDIMPLYDAGSVHEIAFSETGFSPGMSAFTMVLPLKLLPFPPAQKLYEEGVRYSKGAFGALLVFVSQLFAPTTMIISFERDGVGRICQEDIDRMVVRDETGRVLALNLPQKAVLIANHQIYADWWYAWCLTYFMGTHKDVFIVLKRSLKWVPIIGWGMQFFNFIFLARSWASDRVHLAKSLSWLGNRAEKRDIPLTFILYPEGTLVSKDTRPVSKKYAEKLGIADMQHTLLPRSTGLQYSLRTLAPRIPSLKLIDITMAYPGIPRFGYGQSYYTLRSIFLDGVPPPQIHMHIRCFDVAHDIPIGDLSATNSTTPNGSSSSVNKSSVEVEIPEGEKETFDRWLRELWRAKDEDMAGYLQSGSFVNDRKLRIEIPLALRRRRDILDAFCFFIPAAFACLLSKLR
ncbi:hypothetical protein NM688_g4742 [Phlebia brevispora]|uniref:Uncharacterized protein n=1 Tax=Phlebia brevispora TaxID=194682 RepID=A0ACC1T250_9APHY|nr:hypothetical protein NM688_g4742 [Phlebia brevispora]